MNNSAEPDDGNDGEDEYETHEESSQRYRKTKDQKLVEYIAGGVKIGEEMKFEAENVEGDRKGNPENLKIDSLEWESLSERIKRMRREKQQKLEEAERMDALTKKPLNFDQEEETRKVETSKWYVIIYIILPRKNINYLTSNFVFFFFYLGWNIILEANPDHREAQWMKKTHRKKRKLRLVSLM